MIYVWSNLNLIQYSYIFNLNYNLFCVKAYDQPDVYETFDLPEDDQQLDYTEEVRFN